MAEFDDNMRGVLFREEEKRSDKAPDYKGNVTINGVKFQLAGWVKESRAGKKFLSIKVEDGDGQRRPAQRQESRRQSSFDDDDSVPF